jgi:hypothetical protein
MTMAGAAARVRAGALIAAEIVRIATPRDHTRKETTMEPMTEQELRALALTNAVGHRLSSETAEAVVDNAEKYFQFLKRPNAEKAGTTGVTHTETPA